MKPGTPFATLIFLLISLLLAAPGCRPTLAPDGVYSGDAILYQADRAIVSAYSTFDRFVKWELDNRAALAEVPEIRKAADNIRANAREWIDSAIRLRDAYESNPTQEGRNALESAVKVLRQALAETARYLAK